MGSQVDNGSKDLDSTVLRCQINQFSRHIVGFSAESDGVGKYLGTGILVPSPTANVPALATCSHVLSELKAREVVFARHSRLTGDGHKKNAWAHVKLSGDFNCFDFGDSESLAGIGLDPLKDAKDLASLATRRF